MPSKKKTPPTLAVRGILLMEFEKAGRRYVEINQDQDRFEGIGSRWFSARVNIKNISRGKLFKDVTQIKEVTQDIMSSYGSNPKSQFLRTSSMSNIRTWTEKVNGKIQAVFDKVSPNHAEQMERYTELKNSDSEAALLRAAFVFSIFLL